MKRSLPLLAALSLPLLAAVAACSSPAAPGDATQTVSSPLARDLSPVVPPADAEALRAGNTSFATGLYQELAADPKNVHANLFFSPFSISEALAMAYAGARGQTATQMATALDFNLPSAQLHPAFDSLDLALASRGAAKPDEAGNDVAFHLAVSNAIWGAPEDTWERPFLDTLAVSYGGAMHVTDFAKDPDGSRVAINGWVSDKTNDKINDLIPQGAIDGLTRIVLTNAVYFKASWQTQFSAGLTQPQTFHAPTGDVQTPMMHDQDTYAYAAGDGYRAISLPYQGGMSFVAILPDDLAAFEGSLDDAKLAAVDAALTDTLVVLTLPKFTIKGATISVNDALAARGMVDAFTGNADFTGMTTTEPLFISHVLHQAFIALDEQGTEAAAATAVIGEAGAAAPTQPPKQVLLTLDKPFVFYIRDDATKAVLFLGRVESP